MSANVLILVGLGNPGAKYARHRHNVGFLAVDAIADAHGFGPARTKFQSELREGSLDWQGEKRKAIALKPQTYMNDSGQAVGEAARFFKAELADIIVFHDELDLAAGKVKVKTGGGNAGHNGLRSLDAHLGADYRRVRIGIGHPGEKARVTGHVLGDFAKADAEWLDPLIAGLAAAAPALIEGDARFTTDLALRLAPKVEKKPPLAEARAEPAPSPKAEPQAATNAFTQALQKIFPRKD